MRYLLHVTAVSAVFLGLYAIASAPPGRAGQGQAAVHGAAKAVSAPATPGGAARP